MHPHASRRSTKFDCCWPFHCGVMAEFVDAPDPVDAEGGELFVEGGAFWLPGGLRSYFQPGVFSCAVEASVGLDVVDKHRRGWLRRRRCDKQSRVDSDKDIDEDCGGGAGVHWGQQGGNWRNIGECCCKTVLSVHAEYFQNMKRQRGELKKCSRCEPKREKEDCLQDTTSQNACLLSNVLDADDNFLYYQKCIMSVLGMPQ